MQFHKQQLDMFESMRQSSAGLAHAYLLTGPAGVGKLDFVSNLIPTLQNTDPAGVEGAGSDVFRVQAPLAVKEARDMIRGLAIAPYLGQYKIIIINNAERLNSETSNTLLKPLEEPPRHVLFFLITAHPDRLLNTIRSRCFEVKFGFVRDTDIEKAFDTKSIQALKPHWSGRPAFTTRLIEDNDYRSKIKQYRTDFTGFTQKSIPERFKIAENYAKMDKDDFNTALRIWMEATDSVSLQKHLLAIYKSANTTNANIQYQLNNLAIQ